MKKKKQKKNQLIIPVKCFFNIIIDFDEIYASFKKYSITLNEEWLSNNTFNEYLVLVNNLKDTSFNDKVNFRIKGDDLKEYTKFNMKQREYFNNIKLPEYVQSEGFKIKEAEHEFAYMNAIAENARKNKNRR